MLPEKHAWPKVSTDGTAGLTSPDQLVNGTAADLFSFQYLHGTSAPSLVGAHVVPEQEHPTVDPRQRDE